MLCVMGLSFTNRFTSPTSTFGAAQLHTTHTHEECENTILEADLRRHPVLRFRSTVISFYRKRFINPNCCHEHLPATANLAAAAVSKWIPASRTPSTCRSKTFASVCTPTCGDCSRELEQNNFVFTFGTCLPFSRGLAAMIAVQHHTMPESHAFHCCPRKKHASPISSPCQCLCAPQEVAESLRGQLKEGATSESEWIESDQLLRSRINKVAGITILVLLSASGWQLVLLNRFFRYGPASP